MLNQTSRSRPIYQLQTMLRLLRRVDPALPTVNPDGIYGNSTQNAVLAFQTHQGLPATGITDAQTWNSIVAAYLSAQVFILQPQSVTPRLTTNQVLRLGESNHHLFLVQGMLLALHHLYPELPAPEATGVLDEATAASLRFLQEKGGLPVTGELDRATWQLLALFYGAVLDDGHPV